MARAPNDASQCYDVKEGREGGGSLAMRSSMLGRDRTARCTARRDSSLSPLPVHGAPSCIDSGAELGGGCTATPGRECGGQCRQCVYAGPPQGLWFAVAAVVWPWLLGWPAPTDWLGPAA